jgi:hypothetical protein
MRAWHLRFFVTMRDASEPFRSDSLGKPRQFAFVPKWCRQGP